MIVARVSQSRVVVIDRLRDRVQLGAGLDNEGNLTEEAMARALACLARFGQRLSTIENLRARAVATNTLRRARNRGVFLARAQEALGVPVEVISGQEEARLIYLGVAHALADDRGRRLVVDIGGGSTEVVIGERFEPIQAESLPMGCVRFTQRFFPNGRLRPESFHDAIVAARQELEPFKREFRRLGWIEAVGASGTVLAIEGILRRNRWTSDGIDLTGLRRLREVMVEAGRVRHLNLEGLSSERAGVLAGGVAILTACFESLDIQCMTASNGALREGLVYDSLGRNTHEDVRLRTIDRFESRFEVDAAQAQRVEETALRCLQDASGPWDLTDEDARNRLRWAARLHEVGLIIAHSGHHNHGAYLIGNSDMSGFSRVAQEQLAALVRAHRRRLRSSTIEALHRAGGARLFRLALLLRLAACLHRGRSPEPLPVFTVKAFNDGTEATLELRFVAGWLDERPMTRADLTTEQGIWANAGFRLVFS